MIYAIDIGSTMIKAVAMRDHDGALTIVDHAFHPRDYDAGIEAQVSAIIDGIGARDAAARFRICSSANGGLRVGIVCLSARFSGRVAENLAACAGANVLFVRAAADAATHADSAVDALIVTGGIDGPDAGRLEAVIGAVDLSHFHYRTLIYAGSGALAPVFCARHPQAVVVANPLGPDLDLDNDELMHVLRNAYLDDLVEKEGMARLRARSEVPIWPTPAVVSAAFHAISGLETGFVFPTPFVLIDIGGATTDVHFGIELLADDGEVRVDDYPDDNRHVFTDLGVSSSRASTSERLANHPRLHDFVSAVDDERARDLYAQVREGDAPEELLVYACYFLALDAVGLGHAGARPRIKIEKASAIVVTGGASQFADATVVERIGRLLVPTGVRAPEVVFDQDYEIWTWGIRGAPSVDDDALGRTGSFG